jgi:uncharacterized RDD family membrane protein YckC
MEKNIGGSRKERTEPLRLLSCPSHRLLAGLFDISVLILGTVIIVVPSLLVFISAITRPSPSRTIAVYVVMFFTGAIVAAFDILYRIAVPYFYKGETLGLRFYKMRLFMENGSEITLKALLQRALATFFLVVLTLGLYYLIEACVVTLGDTHRSFVDTITSTIVVDIDDEEIGGIIHADPAH